MGKPIELTIRELVEDGLIEEEWDSNINDFKYKLTEKGVKKMKRLVRTSATFVWNYFIIFCNMRKNEDFWKVFNEFNIHLLKDFGVKFIPIFLYFVKKGCTTNIKLEKDVDDLANELVKLNLRDLMKIARIKEMV